MRVRVDLLGHFRVTVDGRAVSAGDWRRARSVAQEPGSSVLGCWCIGTPTALAALDTLAPNRAFHGARYLAWGKRLSQILGRPRLQLDGRDVGALAASKGAAGAWLCGHLGDRGLHSSHEARAAQNGQSVLLNDDWLLPQLFDRQVELQKPPLYYWLVAWFGWLNGGLA